MRNVRFQYFPLIFSKFLIFFKSYRSDYKPFYLITGQKPINLALYQQAVSHSSAAVVNDKGMKESYERLEFLGDAVLDMIVAEYLYSLYPYKEEGFLTDLRSKMVNREALNKLALKIGIQEITRSSNSLQYHQSIYGDCLESLIAAVYLDRGFQKCKHFVINKLIKQHFNLDELAVTIINYKSKLLEWCQSRGQTLSFKIEEYENHIFVARAFINGKPNEKGEGLSKKKAEQSAAMATYKEIAQN